MSLEPAGTWAHHRRFRGPGGVTALGIVTTPRAERSTQRSTQQSTQQSRALDVGERQNKKCCGVEVQYTIALQDLHCRTCTPHTLLCDTHTALPHCTTLHTLQYTHHILHHTARVIYQLGGAQLQRQLHRHHCRHTTAHTTAQTPLRIPRGGGRNRLVGRTHLPHRDMHVQR